MAVAGRVRDSGVWDVEPGTFRSNFDVDRLFVVVSGAATVTLAEGAVLELTGGSTAIFKPGDVSVWHVSQRLRKVFHIALG